MGKHTGFRVKRNRAAGTWTGMVRVDGRYRCKNWPTAADARAWARSEAAKLATGAIRALPGRALLSQLAQAYLENLEARGRSASHLGNVRRTLTDLAVAVPDLTAPGCGLAIERWLDAAGGAPASRNRRLVEIRALCTWCIRRDLLSQDPTRMIDRASVPDVLRPQFTLAETTALMAWPTPDPPARRRVALMLLAGLRDDEAAALRWCDVDLGGQVLLIRNVDGHRLKRGRERIVPLQPALRAILGDTPEPPVFPAYDGSHAPEQSKPRARNIEAARRRGSGPDGQVAPMIDPNTRRWFPAYLTACGVAVAGRTAHSCRHTYAGIMTATGVPGPLLSAYLGHTSAATTMIYTRMAALHVGAVAGWPRGTLLPLQLA